MTKQQAMRYWDEFAENVQESASDEVCKTYSEMCSKFDEYLSVVTDEIFQQVFRYGYEKGFEAASKGKTV